MPNQVSSSMNLNDDRRDKILRFLYDRHQTAKGITAIPIGIQELRREMKSRHGMKQPEVASNLDYLIQVGWVRPEVKSRSFLTAGGMVQGLRIKSCVNYCLPLDPVK